MSENMSLVRLVRLERGRPIAGVGVVVGSKQILTCAHVVNIALGRGEREQEHPEVDEIVTVEFPLREGGTTSREGFVAAWTPPSPLGVGRGDIAGIELSEDIPTGVAPARLSAKIPSDGTLRVFGYPSQPPRRHGVWVDLELKGTVGDGLIQVESRVGQTVKAQPGFSGSPVWERSAAGVVGVVGLITGTAFPDALHRDAYLIGAMDIARAWEDQFDYLLVPPNPYRGLRAFDSEHAPDFYGRDADIAALEAMVREHRTVAVIGASGVGKSSLVQAGLLPALSSRATLTIVVMRPSRDPWHALSTGLLRAQHGNEARLTAAEVLQETDRLRREGFGPIARFLRGEGRSLLVHADQFEEAFSVDGEPDRELIDLLIPPTREDDGARILLTMRADFVPALVGVPDVGRRLSGCIFGLSPMTESQLHDVIAKPAANVGVRYASGLVERIARDAGPGTLPMLQFALEELWTTQRKRLIDWEGYDKLGTVVGALDRAAETAVKELPVAVTAILDRLLLKLVFVTPGDVRLATRRRVRRSDVSESAWQALMRLADARIVVINSEADGAYAELAHEALLTDWGRLSGLVHENADFLAWLANTERRAAEGDPLTEARIAEARGWLDQRPDDVPLAVRAFVGASETAAEERMREVEEARERAEHAATRADALRLAATADITLLARENAVTRALALAIESMSMLPTAQGDAALRRALDKALRPVAVVKNDSEVVAVAFSSDGSRVAAIWHDGWCVALDVASGDEVAAAYLGDESDDLNENEVYEAAFDPGLARVVIVQARSGACVLDVSTADELWRFTDREVGPVEFSPDGTRIAAGSWDHSARVWDAVTGDEISRLHHDHAVQAIDFSPDGTKVATGSRDRSVRVMDTATGAELARLYHDDEGVEPDAADETGVTAVQFSPEGMKVMSTGRDYSTRLMDVATGSELTRVDSDELVYAMGFSPDGGKVAIGTFEGLARVMDADSGAEISRHEHYGSVYAIAFSPDSRTIATGCRDGSARLIDALTGTEVGRLDHDDFVQHVKYSLEGSNIATGSRGGMFCLLETVTGGHTYRIQHGDIVTTVDFCRDGTKLATTSRDRTVRLLDALSGEERLRLDLDDFASCMALSPDGTRLAVGGWRLGIRLLDCNTGVEIAHCGTEDVWGATSLAFSPDGAKIASVSSHRSVHMRDARTLASLYAVDHSDSVHAVAFSLDGNRVATASQDRSAMVVDVATGTILARMYHGHRVNAVAFSPDSARLATASADRSARVWDVNSGVELARLNHDEWPVVDVAFSPDGTKVATAGYDRSARVMDAFTGEELAHLYHDGAVLRVQFSPDGTVVATASQDHSARVMDASSGIELVRLEHDGVVNDVAFNAEGTMLATASSDGVARLILVDAQTLIQRAIYHLPRPLTEAEHRQFGLATEEARHAYLWHSVHEYQHP